METKQLLVWRGTFDRPLPADRCLRQAIRYVLEVTARGRTICLATGTTLGLTEKLFRRMKNSPNGQKIEVGSHDYCSIYKFERELSQIRQCFDWDFH